MTSSRVTWIPKKDGLCLNTVIEDNSTIKSTVRVNSDEILLIFHFHCSITVYLILNPFYSDKRRFFRSNIFRRDLLNLCVILVYFWNCCARSRPTYACFGFAKINNVQLRVFYMLSYCFILQKNGQNNLYPLSDQRNQTGQQLIFVYLGTISMPLSSTLCLFFS